ncbi:unnamed protein product [Linum tenue]|uniref:Uncharacterized protein n=1 Tax=Linum tenue TaxID=586396 RepID=A0AAV0HYE1_9ROSI|nr:unnamed protein product [Linum tenue]
MISDITRFSEPFPTKMRGYGFQEESYSAHEEESYHSEEEFHSSSNGSSGGIKFFQPAKFQSMSGHDGADWKSNNKFNHSDTMNHQNGGWGGHDAHRFDQGHGMKQQYGGWNNNGHDAHRFDQGHGMKQQHGGWNNGHDAHRFDQGHGMKQQHGGWNNGLDAHRFDQGHGMKQQNGSWNNGHHGLESAGGMMNGKYGTTAVTAAHQKVQYPAAHSFIHEEEAMTGYNGGHRFSGFNDSFGGGYGRNNGCSNVDWMSKAI